MALKIEDFNDPHLMQSVRRAAPRQKELLARRMKVSIGQGKNLETEERKLEHTLRQATLAAEESDSEVLTFAPGFGQEANIGPTNDILSVEFLEFGLLASKSVCRISNGFKTGTGFLVGNGLLITNHHVFPTPQVARNSILEFNFVDNRTGKTESIFPYGVDPEAFFLTDEALDFTITSIAPIDGMPNISNFGWHPLFKGTGKILTGDPVNIVQHPRGESQKIVLHNSHLLLIEDGSDADAFCWYSGDTQPGSSGSPVFNKRWEVIALHHEAIPRTNKNNEILDINGKTMTKERAKKFPEHVSWIANEGIRISRIVKFIENSPFPDTQKEDARINLLALWQGPLALRKAQMAVNDV